MNWLIKEKIFTYFYNKFRSVNRTNYMKCGVNISLHNISGCFRRSVAPWITVLSWHTEFTKRAIYIFVILRETRHHAQAHVTSGTLIHCTLSLAARRTQTAVQLRWWFRWPVFV